MSIGYFPQIYPGESFYSIVARLKHHIQFSSLQITYLSLFNARSVEIGAECPVRLGNFCKNTSAPFDAEYLAEKHTLIPYSVGYRAGGLWQQFEQSCAYRSGQDPKSHRLERRRVYNSFSKFAKNSLHYCRDCWYEMSARGDERYWIRDHQVPSALCCLKHGTWLQDSSISTRKIKNRLYLPTDVKESLVVHKPNFNVKSDIIESLAKRGIELLDRKNSDADHNSPDADLIDIYSKKGMLSASGKVDASRISTETHPFISSVSEIWPGLVFEKGKKTAWVCLLHSRGSAHDPLKHIVMREALSRLPDC